MSQYNPLKNPIRTGLVVLSILFFASCGKNQEDKPLAKTGEFAEPFHHTSADACKGCHEEIYDEWKSSMHAKSTALKDPIHGMVYEQVMGSPHEEGLTKNGKYPVCLNCHAPIAAIDGKTKLDSNPVYNEGINCVVCHTLKERKPLRNKEGKMQYGVQAYVMSHEEGILQGPSGRRFKSKADGLSRNYHPRDMEPNSALMKTNDACMGCHDERHNGKGVAVCETGKEYKQSGSQVSCQSCHMPVVNGRVSHAMVGGHSEAMVARGARLEMKTRTSGDQIQATVEVINQLPHDFPTGAPFRNAYIRIFALDKDGEVIWKNFENHPIEDSPESVFRLIMKGANGKESSPPAATGILEDGRVEPFGKKAITYTFPQKGVALVKAELYYSLLLPGQIKKNKDRLKDEHTKVKLVSTVEKRF